MYRRDTTCWRKGKFVVKEGTTRMGLGRKGKLRKSFYNGRGEMEGETEGGRREEV